MCAMRIIARIVNFRVWRMERMSFMLKRLSFEAKRIVISEWERNKKTKNYLYDFQRLANDCLSTIFHLLVWTDVCVTVFTNHGNNNVDQKKYFLLLSFINQFVSGQWVQWNVWLNHKRPHICSSACQLSRKEHIIIIFNEFKARNNYETRYSIQIWNACHCHLAVLVEQSLFVNKIFIIIVLGFTRLVTYITFIKTFNPSRFSFSLAFSCVLAYTQMH